MQEQLKEIKLKPWMYDADMLAAASDRGTGDFVDKLPNTTRAKLVKLNRYKLLTPEAQDAYDETAIAKHGEHYMAHVAIAELRTVHRDCARNSSITVCNR